MQKDGNRPIESRHAADGEATVTSVKTDDFQAIAEFDRKIAQDPFEDSLRDEREKLAWHLYENSGTVGSIILGELLLRQERSRVQPNIDAPSFGREIITKALEEIHAKEWKTGWEWYYLGICYRDGICTLVDHAKAAEAFEEAGKLGIAVAAYEYTWATYLSGRVSEFGAIEAFQREKGLLQKKALASERALTLLALGPTRHIGSREHVFRVLQLTWFRPSDYGSHAAAEHLRRRVAEELAMDVEALKHRGDPLAALTLHFIELSSEGAGTSGEDASSWFFKALHPDNDLLRELILGGYFDPEDLEQAAERCQENGWGDSKLAEVLDEQLTNMGW